MQTLTMNAIDRDGNPASGGLAGNGYMIVANVDNPASFGAIIPVVGSQKWSVPAGDYEVRAFIWTWFQKPLCFSFPTGQQCFNVWDYSMSFVWDPQIHVNQDTTVTLDARSANPIPIPATPDSDTSTGWRHTPTCCRPEFHLVSDRVARDGSDIPWDWQSSAHAIGSNDASLEMYAAPSTTATTGALHFYTYLRLESPSTHHVYDLIEAPSDTAVPASFPTSVPAADLAAISTSYDSEVPSRPGGQVRLAYQPWEYWSTRLLQRLAEPLTRTEYVLADPASAQTLWRESAVMYSTSSYPSGDVETGPYISYTPGQQPAVTWFEAPRHPGIDQPGSAVPPASNGVGGMICPACRDGNQLSLDIKPYVGADPQQWAGALDTGNPFRGTSIRDSISVRYYQNGSLISTQDRSSNSALGFGPVILPMTSQTAQYRVDYDVTRSSPWSSLSAQTHTSWQFTSQAPNKSDPLPTNWSCGQLTSPCAFVPLLFVDYSIPLDAANNASAPGTFTFQIHVYHQPHAATTASLQTPAVSVSYDDGTTWAPAGRITDLGGGTYHVTVTHPDPSSVTGFVSLRVQASDSAGASIDQSIIRAYILQGSAAAAAPVGNIGSTSGSGGTAGGSGSAGSNADIAACAGQQAPYASCNALVATDSQGQPLVTAADQVSPSAPPRGYGPADLQAAYNLSTLSGTQGANQTVAVVDAAGDPNIEADLATYRTQYGLPPCTTANGCLRIVNQTGTGLPPSWLYQNPGWGIETALDLDMVSAACPACHILLVVANNASFDALGQAEDTAVRLGANVVSNSYGAYEFGGVESYAPYYQHPGVPIVASSGDFGFGLNGTLGGTQFPASLPTVTAVGGTSLTRDPGSSRGWTETAWAGAGSGCSAYFAKPAWQRDAHCNMRTVADIAAVADPATGVAIYDSYLPFSPQKAGWLVAGGTSAAAPLIAGIYGLAGNGSQASDPSYLYAHAKDLYDVTSGSNGTCGLGNYLCIAKHGYDGPTGLGTPDGPGGF